MPRCLDCYGTGRLLRRKTTADQVPETYWLKCPHCKGKGKVSGPSLLLWPLSRGPGTRPDHCDQCGKAAQLWSFELAEDEVALCVKCLAALHKAIGKVLRERAAATRGA